MKEEEETLVIYRRFLTGEVIALFPEILEDEGRCSSYMHVGQHGEADYSYVIRQSKPVDISAPDVVALHKELEIIGYKLRTGKRYTQKEKKNG